MRIGLLGEKLSHSLSPLIHNFIYEKLSLNLNYELFETSQNEIDNFQDYMRENEIFAVNITIPYKKNFLENLDFISENAKKISAINLMYLKEDKFYGENTDYFGFKYTLENNKIDVKDKRIYIIGKGGAALAVHSVLYDLGARDINYLFRESKSSEIKVDKDICGDILINATPVGMYPNTENFPLTDTVIPKFKVAVDLIYNPLETKFLKIAKRNELKTVNGLEMLIEQAIKTNEILFNKKFSIELREDLKKYLEDYFSKNSN